MRHNSESIRLRIALILIFFLQLGYIQASMPYKSANVKEKVDSLLAIMTLDEKIGQLNQYSWNFIQDDTLADNTAGNWFRKGMVGSVFNVNGIERLRKIQDWNLQYSRLKIPMIFAGDVGNGYSVEFPIPLAESCSWNPDLMRKTTRIAAEEATASGICWTFAPMVDISHDPRWGRVQEGAGEDPWLASLIAAARVEGYQGLDQPGGLSRNNTMMATAKHFAAYGAAQAGRDYHQVDMSDHTFRNIYLQPFQAAVNAGCASVMSAFNELNGVPCTGNSYLLKDILRDELGFHGVLVSDYTSINEMVDHGFAENREHATYLAFKAGVDVDMIGENYVDFLKTRILDGTFSENELDRATGHVLEMKFLTGLFDDPYRYLNKNRQDTVVNKHAFLQAALESARQSIVLLKNQHEVLPVKDLKSRKILLVGPYTLTEMFVSPDWRSNGVTERKSSMSDWFRSQNCKDLQVVEACSLFPEPASLSADKNMPFVQMENPTLNDSILSDLMSRAERCDLIVALMGEDRSWVGEGNSRADIRLPGIQRELLRHLKLSAKPMVLILLNGRPLDLSWEDENLDAILEAWYPGMMGAEAVLDILKGVSCPTAKLTMTFPRSTGQIPVYYNRKLYSSELKDTLPGQDYKSVWLDQYNSPLYPFGYGISYAHFRYHDLNIDRDTLHSDQDLTISVHVRNESDIDATEIVQLYARQCQSDITPETQYLIGFRRVLVPAGKDLKVSFVVNRKTLSVKYLDRRDPGDGKYELWISPHSGPLQPRLSFCLYR